MPGKTGTIPFAIWAILAIFFVSSPNPARGAVKFVAAGDTRGSNNGVNAEILGEIVQATTKQLSSSIQRLAANLRRLPLEMMMAVGGCVSLVPCAIKVSTDTYSTISSGNRVAKALHTKLVVPVVFGRCHVQ